MLWHVWPQSERDVLTASFDLLGQLPTGTTVLEASAGTGKTYTIAALVTRYVAEGVATMDQLLVVSFSRESTRELRERVRERLVSARDGILAPDPRRRGPRSTWPPSPPMSSGTAAQARGGARHLRRRHRHDHARLLPAGAARARHRRRPRPRRRTDRGRRPTSSARWPTTSTCASGDGPTPTRRLLKPAEFRELATAAAKDRTSTLLPAKDTDGAPGSAGPHRRRRTNRGRQAQAPPAPDRLRRPAAAPRRRAHQPDDPRCRGRPAARPLPHRAGRRVPGHRPGAVADPARPVPRPRDAGTHRRPQAGDLRLPRRRRLRLPRRGRDGRRRSAPCRPAIAPTPACSTGWPPSSAAPRSATRASAWCRSPRSTPGGWSLSKTTLLRYGCGCSSAEGSLWYERRSRGRRCPAGSRRRPHRRGGRDALRRRDAAPARRLTPTGRCTRATSRCSSVPTPRPRSSATTCARPASPSSSPGAPASSAPRRPTSGSCCSRRSSNRTAPHRVRRLALSCFVGLTAARPRRAR